jgi:hypothetical protein
LADIIDPFPAPGGDFAASLIQLADWVKVMLLGCCEVFRVEVPETIDAVTVPPLYISGLRSIPAWTVASSNGMDGSLSNSNRSNSKVRSEVWTSLAMV